METLPNGNIPITKENFPNDDFRTFIKKKIAKGAASLTPRRIMETTKIDIKSHDFSHGYNMSKQLKPNKISLQGLDVFTELKTLLIRAGHSNQIDRLDLSHLKKLEDVTCLSCGIKELIIGENNNLTSLICSDNRIEKLDLKGVPYLQILDCSNNSIRKIDASKNGVLKSLVAEFLPIEELILADNPCIGSLYLGLSSESINFEARLSSESYPFLSRRKLNAGSLPLLQSLYLSKIPVKEVDLTKNKKLYSLSIEGCSVEKLLLPEEANIRTLIYNGNTLKELDLKKMKNLQSLKCNYFPGDFLDLSECTNLKTLEIKNAAIRCIDVSKCSKLSRIYCSKSDLVELDLSGLNLLEALDCRNSHIKRLDVTGCERLEYGVFHFSGNPLRELIGAVWL